MDTESGRRGGTPADADLGASISVAIDHIGQRFSLVTSWSRLDNCWEGIAFWRLAERVQPKPHVQYVIGEDDWGYTANLPLEVLMDDDVLLAYRHDGCDLEAVHGGPLRLVVPKRYAWKSSNGCGPVLPRAR